MKNKILRNSLIASLLCLNVCIGSAQKKLDSTVMDKLEKQLNLDDGNPPTQAEYLPLNKASDTVNASYNSFRFEQEMKMYDFNAAHQQRTFMWQYYSGIFIFIMVVTIVGMGLVLSFKQFQLTAEQVRYNLKASKEERITIETGGSTSMEILPSSMKINTAVIGLAILFLSLAFFFLYLKYVYVIEVINTGL